MKLAIRDVEALLGVPGPTLYNWIHSRQLPARRVGEQFRFEPVELLDWALATGTPLVRNPWSDSDQDPGDPLLEALERGGPRAVAVPGSEDRTAAMEALMDAIPEVVDPMRAVILSRLASSSSPGFRLLPGGIALPDPLHLALAATRRPIIRFCYPSTGLTLGGEPQRPRARLGSPVKPPQPISVWCWILATVPAEHWFLLADLALALSQTHVSRTLVTRRPWPEVLTAFRERRRDPWRVSEDES